MTPLYGLSSDEVRQIVDKVNSRLHFKITDATIKGAISDVSTVEPTRQAVSALRKIIGQERDKITQTLCDRLSRKFDYEPKPRDLIVAVEAAGYSCSREFPAALMRMLKERNAERWALASTTSKRLSLLDGEVAMWNALQRTYNMNTHAVASMLLRMFAIVTRTGKVDLLEVPYLAGSLADKDLERFAGTLNFTVKKTRKSRV